MAKTWPAWHLRGQRYKLLVYTRVNLRSLARNKFVDLVSMFPLKSHVRKFIDSFCEMLNLHAVTPKSTNLGGSRACLLLLVI